jgi:zinc protease
MTHHARSAALTVLFAMCLSGPVFLHAQHQQQRAPKWPSSSAPRPLPAHEVKFPPYELRSLPNGLQVVVVMHHEQPAVSLRLIVGAGSVQDPAGKPGVAALLTSVLDQGTTTKSAQQVADAIDFVGGKLDTGIGRDLCWARVVVMKDSLPLGMSLLADVIRNPEFAEEEVARQRQQTLSALQVSGQDPDYVANVVFERLVYGSSPYGVPGNGTRDSVEEIGRDDLVSFHRTYFAPNNSLLAVVGDVTVEEAMVRVSDTFGDWERRSVPATKTADPPEPQRRVVIVDKPDAVQTVVRVGQLGIPRKAADYMALDLAIKVLGGEGANRLHRVLRTERGLTYGVRADAQTLKRAGMIVAKTDTRTEATGEVLRLIADEYSKLRRERVGDEELSDAKAYLTGHFPLTIETPDDIAAQVLDVLFFELPVEELQTYRQRVNAVGVDDVARVAWRYVRPDRLAVVLVGNASAFAGQLKGVGFGKYEVVKLAELDLGTPDFRRKAAGGAPGDGPGVATLDANAGPRHGPFAGDGEFADVAGQVPSGGASDAAQAVVAHAIEAKGGRAKLESVKTVEAAATTTLMTPRGPVKTETTTYIQYPDRFRVEARVKVGTVVQVYAGQDHVWVQDPVKGVIDVPAQARKDFKASVERDLIPLLLRAGDGQVKVRLLPPGADAKIQSLEVSGGGMDDPVTLDVDAQSGLVMRESYRLAGGSGNAEELFSDYRDVDGLKIAFSATVRRNGLPVLERAVSSFKINPTLKPGLFDPPSSGKGKEAAPAQPPVAPPSSATPGPPPAVTRPAPVPAAPPVKAAAPAAVAPTPKPANASASEPEALAIVRKAIDAAGGLDKLKAVKTVRMTATNLAAAPDGPQKAESATYMQYPDRFRVDVKQWGKTVIALLVGDSLVLRTADGAIESPAVGSEPDRSFKSSIQRDPIPLLLRIDAGDLRVRVVPQDTAVKDISGEQLVQVTGARFESVVLGFDAKTGLLQKVSYAAPGDQDGPWLDDVYSDYRDVSGVKVAFKAETRLDTQAIRRRVVKEVVLNAALDPALFDKTRLK